MKQPKLPLALPRTTTRKRAYEAGCSVCHGTTARWVHSNAQALAATHHDRTGHRTWVRLILDVTYGGPVVDDHQTDIEDAIAASSSGGQLHAAPLPASDAPTATSRRRERPTPHCRTVSRGAKTLAPETPLP